MQITFEAVKVGAQASNAEVTTISEYTLIVDGSEVGRIEQLKGRDERKPFWGLYLTVDGGTTLMAGPTRKNVVAQFERNFSDFKPCMWGECNGMTKGDGVTYICAKCRVKVAERRAAREAAGQPEPVVMSIANPTTTAEVEAQMRSERTLPRELTHTINGDPRCITCGVALEPRATVPQCFQCRRYEGKVRGMERYAYPRQLRESTRKAREAWSATMRRVLGATAQPAEPMLALPPRCDSVHCRDCGTSVSTLDVWGLPAIDDEAHYLIDSYGDREGYYCNSCWGIMLSKRRVQDWLTNYGACQSCGATAERIPLWDGSLVCRACCDDICPPGQPKDFTTEWAEPFSVFYQKNMGDQSVIVYSGKHQDAAVAYAQDVLYWNGGGYAEVRDLNAEPQHRVTWHSNAPAAQVAQYRAGDEIDFGIPGEWAASLSDDRPEPDLPTPEMELNWAIHNDHAGDAEPDVREEDFDYWHAQYDDDPNPYHGTYSEE